MPFTFKRPERSRYAAASAARTCALPLCVGMRLLLYRKECVRLRLMSGTLCELVDIVFADEEALPSSEFAGEPILLEFLPVQLLLRAVDAEWVLPRSLLPDLPDDVDRRGLFPLEKHTDSFPLLIGKDDKLHIRRTHFQVVPADTRIVYSAQGESFPARLVDLAKPPGMGRGVHWLANYVMLSRATSLDALLILQLCTP